MRFVVTGVPGKHAFELAFRHFQNGRNNLGQWALRPRFSWCALLKKCETYPRDSANVRLGQCLTRNCRGIILSSCLEAFGDLLSDEVETNPGTYWCAVLACNHWRTTSPASTAPRRMSSTKRPSQTTAPPNVSVSESPTFSSNHIFPATESGRIK